ncbi:hypothetical protein D039_1833B, partial [Vibrio parahaemolyticus EKP-028]
LKMPLIQTRSRVR